MSRIAAEIEAAYKRWTQMNPSPVRPIVRIVMTSGERKYFDGFALAPSVESQSVVTISGVGLNVDTLVIRDSDVYSAQIEKVE